MTAVVSVDESTLDAILQADNIPNLADLFRQAKEQGLITPITNYGGQQGGA